MKKVIAANEESYRHVPENLDFIENRKSETNLVIYSLSINTYITITEKQENRYIFPKPYDIMLIT